MTTQREKKLDHIIKFLGKDINRRGWFVHSDLLHVPNLQVTRPQYLSKILADFFGFTEYRIGSPSMPFWGIIYARNQQVVADVLLNSIVEVKHAE